MSENSLWKIKGLSDYQRKLDSELPPLYDFEQVRGDHREIETVILEYWGLLHPVVQDFITSWWLLWTNMKKENEKLTAEVNQKSSMLANYQQSSENKINDLTDQLKTKQSELGVIQSEIQKKEDEIQNLENEDQESKLGITELRSNLEKKLAELNLKLSEMQARIDSTQSQVAQSFEHKIMMFESEVASLKEQLAAQEQKKQVLQAENQELQTKTRIRELLEDKVWQISDQLKGLSCKET
jgi:septal ring factor EnvC (AmiA/AmiB activator)